jgi:hypothetical protein
MSNNTNTPVFLIILPILVPYILNTRIIYHSLHPSSITQYFHPLPFIGQYFSTPLSTLLPPSSLNIPTLPSPSTEPPTCKRKSPAPELHPKAPYLPPNGGDFLIQQMGFSALVHMAIVIRMLLKRC